MKNDNAVRCVVIFLCCQIWLCQNIDTVEQYLPVRVAFFCEKFYIFVVSWALACGGHIFRKCFRFCPKMRMWKFSMQLDERIALISCLAMWLLHALCIYLILFRCGVYRRLLLHRSFHNLHFDKRNRLHTFCFI